MTTFSALAILLQIVLIDLSMAADNALVVGMAAARLPPDKRRKAIIGGIAGATLLRILFAVFAVRILHLTGLLIAGGLLLLWVGWKMHLELRQAGDTGGPAPAAARPAQKTLGAAIKQIIVADVSMSLDNVLGVAGVARDNLAVLAAGLTLSVVLMGAASGIIARLTARRRWIGYAGLVVILYTALHMMIDGVKQLDIRL